MREETYSLPFKSSCPLQKHALRCGKEFIGQRLQFTTHHRNMGRSRAKQTPMHAMVSAELAAVPANSDMVVAAAKAPIPYVWRALFPTVVSRHPPLFWLVVAFPQGPLALIGPPVSDGRPKTSKRE